MRAVRRLALCVPAGFLLVSCATKPAAGPEGNPTPAPSPTPAPAAVKSPWFSHVKYVSPIFWYKKVFPPKAPPPQAIPPRLVGTVKMVNAADKFVLIDSVGLSAAQPGDVLVCITSQRETASLRASALRNPPFLIADITNGSPSPGDKVYKQ